MAATMLAGRLDLHGAGLVMEQVPVPQPGPDEVLVRVASAGVCLSDVHLIEGMFKPLHATGDKVTLGHEVAGEVAELGDAVAGIRIGDRVLLQAGEERAGAVHTRGVDYDGGWAEYAVATASTLVPIPASLSFDEACFLPDAVSTPWSAITGTGAVRPAEAVGVWGIGGLGTHGVQLLRLIGAYPIVAVDPLPAARERALALGADVTLDPADPDLPARVRAATGGRGLAAVFDFTGEPVVYEQAVSVLAVGGRLVLVGLSDQPLSLADGIRFSYLGQRLLGHYGSTRRHLEELVELVRGRRLELSRSVSARYPLDEAAKAVAALRTKDGSPVRLILKP